ncbi:MAG: small basic protein [Planctomycetota bacterium]|jgi:small basic protein (TIGR04137 family)
MSIHSSLKVSGAGVGVRNVWTRMERLVALKKVGRWEEGDPVTGLPKVRTRFKVKTKKQLKAEAHAGEAVPGAEGAEAGEGEADAAATDEKKG